MLPTYLVVICVLIVSTFIGNVYFPLLVRYGTLYETSKSYVVSVIFRGLWYWCLDNVQDQSHPLVCIAHIINILGHYLGYLLVPTDVYGFVAPSHFQGVIARTIHH